MIQWMLLPPTAEMPKLPLIFIAMDPADCSESSILCLTGQPPQVCLPTVEFYQITNIRWIIEKARQFQKNIYFCFIDYVKAFVWITTNCGKFFKRWEYQTTLPASWEICMQIKKQQLELDMEQQTGSK